MPSQMTDRTFTVRFPEHLHHRIREAADGRRKSVNLLLREIAEDYLRQEEERALYDSFTRLGQDLAECDVEFACEAQRGAIESGDVSH